MMIGMGGMGVEGRMSGVDVWVVFGVLVLFWFYFVNVVVVWDDDTD